MSRVESVRDDRIAESLGRYEIVRRLCVTATSEIFLAKVTGAFGFRRTVVLKVLLREHADDPARVQGFVDEARIAALLHHPNIVQVLDCGMDGGVVYLAMEYLDGLDGRALLKRCKGPLPLQLCLGVAQGTCSALDHAHRAKDDEGRMLGLVHRDVSPSNVILTSDGVVKLIDFGIARVAAQTARTQDGLIKGKLGYMSPEQCKGEPLDERTDVYAVGVLLFELVTGATPHAGRDGYELLRAVVEADAPRAKDRVPALPDSIDRILARSLARPKAERFGSAGELLAELEVAIRDLELDVSPRALARCVRAQGAAPAGADPQPEAVAPGAGARVAPPGDLAVGEAGDEQRPRPTSRRPSGPASRVALVSAVGILAAAGALLAQSALRAGASASSEAAPARPETAGPVPSAEIGAPEAALPVPEPTALPATASAQPRPAPSRRDASPRPQPAPPTSAKRDLDAPLPP
jgi:serine/threonine-protein kinase